MKPSIRTFKSLLTLGLCLLSLIDFRSVTGWVVCLGENGHIALESSPDGDSCLPMDSAPSQAQYDVAPAGDHCGVCRDIAVDGPSLDASLSGRSFSAPQTNAPILAVLYGQYVSDHQAFKRTIPIAPAPGELALIPIRSTVLRI